MKRKRKVLQSSFEASSVATSNSTYESGTQSQVRQQTPKSKLCNKGHDKTDKHLKLARIDHCINIFQMPLMGHRYEGRGVTA
jgi:hypothetical protein